MPQTSPMNWLIISLMFIILISFINISLSYMKMKSTLNSHFLLKKSFNWKW